jgi:hypothetical protein
MSYKIGDKVKVKQLNSGFDPYVLSGMVRFCGHIGIIMATGMDGTRFHLRFPHDLGYHPATYIFTSRMVELASIHVYTLEQKKQKYWQIHRILQQKPQYAQLISLFTELYDIPFYDPDMSFETTFAIYTGTLSLDNYDPFTMQFDTPPKPLVTLENL